MTICSGAEFLHELGGYTKVWDPESQQFLIKLASAKKFDDMKKKVKVIARCTSEEKLVLVTCIKERGGLIGMTGDSIADAQALKQADVGLCMGTGCDVAKDNADLVILDNDFHSIHRSVKWGRALYDNCRKFLQFQITINVVICFVTILGGATIGHPPLNVVQMLWTNLIMDILGAIAIGTEPYSKDRCGPRISRKGPVMVPELWRTIVLHSAYQILVLVVLMFAGPAIFCDEAYNLVTEPPRSPDRKVVDTICFHSFILMTLFNQINCRVVDRNELNVFKTLFNNGIFWIVFLGEFGLQSFILWLGSDPNGLGSQITGTTKLTGNQHVVCWCLGLSVLAINPVVKQVPAEKFLWFILNVNLEEVDEKEGINKLMSKMSAVQNIATEQFREKGEEE